jgi:hypothetical protein
MSKIVRLIPLNGKIDSFKSAAHTSSLLTILVRWSGLC